MLHHRILRCGQIVAEIVHAGRTLLHRRKHPASNIVDVDARENLAGQVDAAVTWEPALSQGANSANGHLLLSSADKPGLITDVVAVTPETAATHQADIKAFVRAWYRALEFIKTNPDEANQIMASGVGGWLADPAVFKQTLAGIEYLDKNANNTFFGSAATPGQISKTLGYALEIWSEKGRIQAKVKPEDLIDYGFIGG